jgi:mono/diheme cytochrome c family protein
MPGFSREQLSDEDLDSLVDYVSYLRQHRAARQPAG